MSSNSNSNSKFLPSTQEELMHNFMRILAFYFVIDATLKEVTFDSDVLRRRNHLGAFACGDDSVVVFKHHGFDN
jgi:hypothetical protein